MSKGQGLNFWAKCNLYIATPHFWKMVVAYFKLRIKTYTAMLLFFFATLLFTVTLPNISILLTRNEWEIILGR
jgi:hypothetical protein